MRKTIATVAISGALLANIPFIPSGEMEFKYAYQYLLEDTLVVTATSTTQQQGFTDDDNNGVISVAVFEDLDGNAVEIQIPDEKYSSMGQRGGYSNNPTKQEYRSVFQLLKPKKAEAAIAFDNSTPGSNGSTVSSLTYAHTVTGTDPLLIVSAYWTSSRTVSGFTYNAVSMTEVVTTLDTGGGERHGMYYLINPATGANNVVITLSGTSLSGIESAASSYTGVDQTDAIDATRTETNLETGTSYSEAITSTVDNTWAVWSTRNYSGVAVSAGANTALREQILVSYGMLLADSNAAITPAGARTVTLTTAGSSNWYTDILVTIIPGAEPAPSATEDIIWFNF